MKDSENLKVSLITRYCLHTKQSIIGKNLSYIRRQSNIPWSLECKLDSGALDGKPSEEDLQIVRTIHELNYSMDNFMDIGFSSAECLDVLSYISAL